MDGWLTNGRTDR